MAAVTQEADSLFAAIAERPPAKKVLLIGLLIWVILGPLALIAYGNHVDTQQWAELAGLPAEQADYIRSVYFVNALVNTCYGAVAWCAGIVLLGELARRIRPQDRL